MYIHACVLICCLFLSSCTLIPALAPSFLEKYEKLPGLSIEDSEIIEVVVLEVPRPVLHPVAGIFIQFTVARFPDGRIRRILVWPDEGISVGGTVRLRAVYGQERMVNKAERDYLGKK